MLAPIAQHASGKSTYSVEVIARDGEQKVSVLSDLKGMALSLPAPFTKTANASWGLSVTQSLNTQHLQELRVEVAERALVRYVQNTAVTPSKVLRGQIYVGDLATAPPLPTHGVAAMIQQPSLDVSAWLDMLPSDTVSTETSTLSQAAMWLPQRIDVNVDRLLVQGRELEAVRATFMQHEAQWRGRLQAQHFAGTVNYQPADADNPSGRIFARLSHLTIPTSEAERLNEAPISSTDSRLESLPALDIDVERFHIADTSLGRLQLKALNRPGLMGREWLLEQFDLTTPEARWRAHGYWNHAQPHTPRSTQLSFLLEMKNTGALLDRFGMPGVIRDGEGNLSGNISWQGAPITPHWPSMGGDMHMQVGKGQFLKVEPGIGKLLSVLSLQSLPRRMTLDFRDVFSQGFAFDFVRGDIRISQGIASTNNLQMKGLNAAVLMDGSANLADETQQLKVVVVPEINAMTASLAAAVINPVVGLGSFLAQMFLRGPLMEAATRTFDIQGTWANPVIEPVSNKTSASSIPGPAKE